MLLTDILKKSALTYSTQPAVTMRVGYRTVTLTYSEVFKQAQKIAAFLQAQGLKKGDCIVILAPNSPYWVCLFWGALLAGVIIVPVTLQATTAMVNRFIAHTQAKMFFTYRGCRVEVSSIPIYTLEHFLEVVAPYAEDLFQPVEMTPDDVMQILYTSGTTGDPKGTMLTHRNIASNVHAITALFRIDGSRERLLSILPLSHIYEQTFGLVMPYSYGAHIIYMHTPAAIRDLMKNFRISKMLAVPEFLKLFMNKVEATAQEKGRIAFLNRMRSLSRFINVTLFSRILFRSVLKQFGGRLDMIASGGAPLDPLLEQKWEDFGVTILQGYGLTETSPVISTNTFEHKRIGSVGKIAPGVEVKFSEEGEILVKGPSVFKGYFKAQDKTQEAFTEDGWFQTGDIGELDADGYLFLKGRKKYMLLGPGGQNVYPDDIEMELNEHPGVKDSCVIGLEEHGGQVQIHAVLLLNPGDFDPKNIIDEVNEKLASYQRVHGYTVWPDIDFPRSSTRKIKKHEVTQAVQEHKFTIGSKNPYVKTPLVKILVDISGKSYDDVGPKTRIIQDLLFDSLALVEMIMRIEEAYAVTIDESKITAQSTVEDIEQLIKQSSGLVEPVKSKSWTRFWWIKGLRFLGQHMLFFITRLFVRYEIKGLENLKDIVGPVVIMPNHVSYFDGVAIARALPTRFRLNIAFAAARDVLFEEFKKFAWLAEFLFNAFSFPRKEQEPIKQGLDIMGQLLDDGCCVVIFPEGTISKEGTLLPLKKGAGLVATEMKAPIIPVIISGAREIFPYGSTKPVKRGKITVTFGKPMTISGLTSMDEATELIFQQMKLLSEK